MIAPHDQGQFKAVLSSIFQRKGGNGQFTRQYDDLDFEQRKMLAIGTQLGDDELPVIGCAETSESWFLLTTKRLVSSHSGQVTNTPIADIKDAVVNLAALQASGRTMLDIRELEIITMHGEHYTIFPEAGIAFSGVWSVLKNVGMRNRG